MATGECTCGFRGWVWGEGAQKSLLCRGNHKSEGKDLEAKDLPSHGLTSSRRPHFPGLASGHWELAGPRAGNVPDTGAGWQGQTDRWTTSIG